MTAPWPRDAASDARYLHGEFLKGTTSATAAVRTLSAMGHEDAWNLWLDVCDEHAPEVGRRVQKKKNPDGSKRDSRPLPAREEIMADNETTTDQPEQTTPVRRKRGNGATNGAKKKGRPPKKSEPVSLEPILLDLFLTRGRSVQVALPGDVTDDDMPALQEQLEAFMNLRRAQQKARGS